VIAALLMKPTALRSTVDLAKPVEEAPAAEPALTH
jgi:hypothetical protein